MTWPSATQSGRPVTLVRWCRSRPSVFFVLDADSFLYIWDLNMDDSAALKHERITHQSRSAMAITMSIILFVLLHPARIAAVHQLVLPCLVPRYLVGMSEPLNKESAT